MGKSLKITIIILISILLLLLLSVNCCAMESDYEAFMKNAPDHFEDKSATEIIGEFNISDFLSSLVIMILSNMKEYVTLTFSLFGIVILFTIIKNMSGDNHILKNTVLALIPVSVIALTYMHIENCICSISDCIKTTTVFCSSAIPVILALCVSSGNSFSGITFSTCVSFVSAVLQRVSDIFLLPLTLIYMSFSLSGNISGSVGIVGIDKQIKKFIKWVIGIFMSVFSLIMSLQSFLASSSDSVLKRSIKNAVGSFIPVVGNTLSSGVDSVFTIASNTKTMFSVVGIIVILSIFLPTIIKCICFGLSLSIAKTFALFLNEDKCSSIFTSISDVFYILSGICSVCVIMTIFSFLIICINFN